MPSARPAQPRRPGLFRWPAASLKTYLILTIVVATVPLGSLTAWLMGQEIIHARNQMYTSLQGTAISLAMTIEREQSSSLEALAILGDADALQVGDLGAVHRMLVRLPELRPAWRKVLLADTRGRTLLSSDRPRGAPQDTWIPAVNVARAVLTRQPVVGHLATAGGQLDARDGTTMVAMPVLVDGQVRYVLAAQMSTWLWQKLLDDTVARTPQLRLILRDARQHTLARSPASSGSEAGDATPPPPWPADTGFQKTGIRAGEEPAYMAWQRVGLSGWSVEASLAATPIEQTHRRTVIVAMAAGLFSLGMGLALALLVARRVSVPLRALARGGADAVRGHVPVRELAALRDALQDAETQRALAYERLEAKAAEFETLFNTSLVGLSITQTPDARVVLRNPANQAMFGRQDSGAPRYRMFHEGQEMASHQQPLHLAARGQAVKAQAVEVVHHDGRTLRLLAHAVPLRDQDGLPRGAIATFVDITAREQARERLVQAERQLRRTRVLVTLAEEAGDVGFLDYLHDADRVTITPSLARLIGAPAETLTMRWADWLDRIHPDDASGIDDDFRQAWRARQTHLEFKFRTRAPEARPRWLTGRMMVVGGTPQQAARMIGMIVDVTAQHQAEQERTALTEAEQRSRLEAEATNRSKDEFLAMLGHELRNPLAAISAAIAVLNRMDAEDQAAERVRHIIMRQTRHLGRLMDELLDMARVMTGKIRLSLQPVQLAPLVQRHMDAMLAAGQLKGHPLELSLDDVWIQADVMRLEQVLSNLLSNAVQYSASEQPIHVTVGLRLGRAMIEVRDHGDGIPEVLLPHIFDIFVQGERTLERRQGGLGVGLSLVKRLVELHGGEISVQSTSSGSIFRVELPAIEAAAAKPMAEPDRSRTPRSLRVLVVEDNLDVMEAVRAMLELHGHQVHGAPDGHAGLEALLSDRPDAALVDIGLPGLTGLDIARMARQAGYTGRLIAMSGYGQAEDVRAAMTSGFDAHMVKPVDAGLLMAHLQHAGAGGQLSGKAD